VTQLILYLINDLCLSRETTKPHVPLVGETSSGPASVDVDGFTVAARRTCGAVCVSVTETDIYKTNNALTCSHTRWISYSN